MRRNALLLSNGGREEFHCSYPSFLIRSHERN
jgi:hypothetical protein